MWTSSYWLITTPILRNTYRQASLQELLSSCLWKVSSAAYKELIREVWIKTETLWCPPTWKVSSAAHRELIREVWIKTEALWCPPTFSQRLWMLCMISYHPTTTSYWSGSLFKTKKSLRKLVLWGTPAETEQSRVNKIKAPNAKWGCKANTLVMVYLQSLWGVEAELGVATLAIPSRSRIPNELLWETNYWGVSWSWRFRYERTLPIICLKDFRNNIGWKRAYW